MDAVSNADADEYTASERMNGLRSPITGLKNPETFTAPSRKLLADTLPAQIFNGSPIHLRPAALQ